MGRKQLKEGEESEVFSTKIPKSVAAELMARGEAAHKKPGAIGRELLLLGLAVARAAEQSGLSLFESQSLPVPKENVKPIVTSSGYLMSDPKGANTGTKRLPKAIRQDIADARAHVEKVRKLKSENK